MALMPEAKLELVRRLVAGAPDAAVRSLDAALSGVGAGDLADVRDLVRREKNERGLRTAVLHPLLGTNRGVLSEPFRFTPGTSAFVWDALGRRRPELLAEAREFQASRRVHDPEPPVFDELCVVAAELEEVATGLGSEAVLSLRFAPWIRSALSRAPAWLGRADPEQAAALRLILKDAAQVVEDGAPRFLNLLSTHFEQPGLLLRFVSAALGRPNDNYLASSELAGLGEALLAKLGTAVEQVKTFAPSQGLEAARGAGACVETACALAQEFEHSLDLARNGPWGARVAEQKRALAVAVEARLREVDEAVRTALPTQPVRLLGRMSRNAPRIDVPPPEAAAQRARALLTFVAAVRASGSNGGFGALHAKTSAAAAERLAGYADEVLAALNAFEAPDEAVAFEHLELTADLLDLIDDPKTAQVVRRRAGVAGSLGASQASA